MRKRAVIKIISIFTALFHFTVVYILCNTITFIIWFNYLVHFLLKTRSPTSAAPASTNMIRYNIILLVSPVFGTLLVGAWFRNFRQLNRAGIAAGSLEYYRFLLDNFISTSTPFHSYHQLSVPHFHDIYTVIAAYSPYASSASFSVSE